MTCCLTLIIRLWYTTASRHDASAALKPALHYIYFTKNDTKMSPGLLSASSVNTVIIIRILVLAIFATPKFKYTYACKLCFVVYSLN